MRFKSLGIRFKMMSVFALPVLLCIIVGASGIVGMRLSLKSREVAQMSTQTIRHAFEIDRIATETEKALYEYAVTGSQDVLQRYKTGSADLSKELAEMKRVLAESNGPMKDFDDTTKLVEKWETEFAQPLIKHAATIANDQSIRDSGKFFSRPRAERSLDSLKEFVTNLRKKAESLNANEFEYQNRVAEVVKYIVEYGLSISTVLALLVSYLMASRMIRHFMAAVTFSEAIAKGDLSGTLNFSSKDEIGRLGASLNTMVSNLKEQIRGILDGVSVLNSASGELTGTVSRVATSTAQTTSALTEVTTTVEQVKQSSRLATDKAKSVSQDARESAAVAETGKRSTESTVEKMNLIRDQMGSIGETVVMLSEHSQQIGTIIASVQDIADQSNLLAVNASIEAARAGEHGKGFAVVAQEIKTLADESKKATEQVRSILEDTKKWVSAVVMATEQGGKAVESGLGQSIQAGEVIGKLSDSVLSSSQAASVIQVSSEQQFVGIEQVATAMVSIEQAMREINNSVTQLEPAAQRLGDLGQALKVSVKHYKL